MDNLYPKKDNTSPLKMWPFSILNNEKGELDPAPEPAPDPAPDPAPTPNPAPTPAPSWKGSLSPDIKNSPIVQKFGDDMTGLENMIKSHHELEKVFSSHEKVPIPKGPDDVDGWNIFSKALGIPNKADGYGLPDAELPESMKNITMDKNKFAEIVHAYKLTPSQAKGMWTEYQRLNIDVYNRTMQEHTEAINQAINSLRGQWGDAYETNVDLGQTVINKFSEDQDMNDFITAVMMKDARGIKFLSKIGDQFAENKIGEFQMKKFSLSPDDALEEINKIRTDPNGAYMNTNNKFSEKEHQAAVDRVNHLYVIANRGKG